MNSNPRPNEQITNFVCYDIKTCRAQAHNAETLIEVEENAPTSDQLASIIEYMGENKVGSVIEGATNTSDALRRLKSGGSLIRPLIVDWNNGRVGNDTCHSLHESEYR